MPYKCVCVCMFVCVHLHVYWFGSMFAVWGGDGGEFGWEDDMFVCSCVGVSVWQWEDLVFVQQLQDRTGK